MHPITDGIDNSFCRKSTKETEEWKQSIINVPASNNKYPYANGNKQSERGSYFLHFSLSIHLFRTLLLYQINKLMHDALISIERHQMLSLLCGDIFSSLDSVGIFLIYDTLLHLMIYCKKREPKQHILFVISGVAGAKGFLLERQFIYFFNINVLNKMYFENRNLYYKF